MAVLRPQVFHGGFYADAWPDGTRAVLLALERKVVTRDAMIPVENAPLYLCCTPARGFQFAGQSDRAPGTVHYHDERVTLDPRIAHGNNGCLFDLAGELHIIEPAANQTSQGYRYVAPDGTLVLGDDAILREEISQPVDLGDGILIGQGHDVDGCVVKIDGARRMLQGGMVYAVRAHRDGERVAVAFYDVQPDGLTAYIYHVTLSELRALPPVPNVGTTVPIPGTPPDPTPDPEPPSMDYLQIIRDIRQDYPTPLGTRHWEFLVEVAQATGTQLYRKEDDNSVLIPSLRKRVSLDVIGRGSLGNRWADILQDSEGQAIPTFQVQDGADGEYVDVSQVELPGDLPPAPLPPDPPPGDLESRVRVLEQWMARVRS
jgi:hypothetical protein